MQSQSQQSSLINAYVVAVAFSLLLLVIRFSSGVPWPSRPIIIFFVIPIIVSSYLGGLGPGLVATAITTLGLTYFLSTAHGATQIFPDVFYAVQLVAFAAIGVLISVISERMHAARRRAEENDERLKNVLDATGEGVWDWSIPDDIVTHNMQWCKLLGLDETFLKHSVLTFFDKVHQDDKAAVRSAIDRSAQEGVPYQSEHRLLRSDGEFIWVLDRGRVVEWGTDGRPTRMVGSMTNITERKAAEAELQRQRALFHSVFEYSPDGMIFTDPTRHILDVNPAFTKVFGYTIDDVRGRTTRCFYRSDAEWLAVGEKLSRAKSISTEIVAVAKSGVEIPTNLTLSELRDETGKPVGLVAVVRDLTAERRRDAELQQKRRLEALGRLTGGIAHDFNNLLAVIGGNVELAGLAKTDEQRKSLLAEAERAVKLGAKLNQNLMTFARQRTLDGSYVDLNDVVTSMLPMIQLVVGERISVSTNFATAAPVHVDVSELENTFLNLATNARDAIADRSGSFSLATSIETVDPATASDKGVQAGQFVRLKATDTGVGMPPEVVSNAIDPFFTTKEIGKGAGLGLATVDGFIRQSGGFLSIESEVGSGTSVSIYLPVSTHDVKPKSASAAERARAGKESIILIVEDNPNVRKIAREQLEHLGYKVIEAASGDEALSLLQRGTAVDLIFSDIVMPGSISGIELCARVAKAWPEIPTLLTSGFSRSTPSDPEPPAATSILNKPYSMADLANAIDKALRSGPAANHPDSKS